MATTLIATVGNNPLFQRNGRKLQQTVNGNLWMIYWDGTKNTTDSVKTAYSTDDGVTWTLSSSFGFTSAATANDPNLAWHIDERDHAHIVIRDPDGKIYYRHGTPDVNRTAWTFTAPTLAIDNSCHYVDITAAKRPDSNVWDAFIVGSQAYTNGQNLTLYGRIATDINGVASATASDNLPYDFGGAVLASLTTGHFTIPSIEFHHTGDGKTVKDGNLTVWATWTTGTNGSGNGIRLRRGVYSSSNSQIVWDATDLEVDNTRYMTGLDNWCYPIFDGTRLMLVGGDLTRRLSSGSVVVDQVLYEVDVPATKVVSTLILKQDITDNHFRIQNGSPVVDDSGNILLFGQSGPNNFNYPRAQKWIRSTGTYASSSTTYDVNGDYLANFNGSALRHTPSTQSLFFTVHERGSTELVCTVGVIASGPNKPILKEPIGNTHTPLSGTPTFRWEFSDVDSASTQKGYEFRRKISGAASYEYWNAATQTWVATEVANDTTDEFVTFPTGAWSDGGTVYNWSVTNYDNTGTFSSYADDATVTGSARPVVDVTAPTGTITNTTRPTVTWTHTDAESNPQVTYLVKIYPSATYNLSNFNPDTTTPVWTSNLASSTALSVQVGIDLANNTDYRAYVQTSQIGDLKSLWDFAAFRVEIPAPVAPSFTITPNTDLGYTTIDVTGNDTEVSGFIGKTRCVIEFSLDGGKTFALVRGGVQPLIAPTQTASVIDNEVPVNVPVTYRVRTEVEVGA